MVSNEQNKVCAQLKLLIKLLKSYQWLSNSYMLNFFADKTFEKLPESWRKLMQLMEIEEFGLLLNYNVEDRRVWPLSLLAIRSLLKKFTLPRKLNSLPYTTNNFELNNVDIDALTYFEHVRLKNIFTKHVKPKKRYEIEKMAEKTATIASKTGVKCVVDVGSGVGHLCRRLAYVHGLRVVGMEAQEDLSERARKLDGELEVTACKHLAEGEIEFVRSCRPTHTTTKIDEHCAPHQFLKMVEDCLKSSEDFGIIGLHPCGDLAPNLLRVFMECERIKFICIVGCCYDKLTLNPPSTGFPLSKFVAAEGFDLKVASAALACHANEASCARLMSGDYQNLRIHCYRAALQTIIRRRWPHLANCAIGNVKHYPHLTFQEYCKKAMNKLGVEVPEEDCNSAEILSYLSQWKEALFYHVVWLMLAPALETLIQLDRWLYLAEQGVACELQACFDPLVSPRNNILSAIKNR